MEFLLLCCLSVGVFIVIIAFAQALRIVKQYEKGVLLRLGKFVNTYNPGIAVLVPFLDTLIKVDMREMVINVPPQQVITEDNVTVVVDAAIYYKVMDPVKSQFEVENFDIACTTLAQTNLRNVIGDLSLDETLTSRDTINTNLRDVLDEATNPWGVKITRVEVQKIDPPADITEAMSRQMKAERDKRASILEAEGVKQAQILEAEGGKEAEVLEAEGDAQAKIRRAEADAEAIRLVSDAAEKYFKERAELKMRLEVTENSLKNNSKFIVPSDSNLVNVLESGDKEIVPIESKN